MARISRPEKARRPLIRQRFALPPSPARGEGRLPPELVVLGEAFWRQTAGFAAVANAIANAVGHDVFKRAPIMADMILLALETGRPAHEPLTANI